MYSNERKGVDLGGGEVGIICILMREKGVDLGGGSRNHLGAEGREKP